VKAAAVKPVGRVLARELALFLIFWVYALALPAHYLLVKQLHRRPAPAPDTMSR